MDRLKQVFGNPDLRWICERVRRRLEGGRALEGVILKNDVTPGEQEALDGLLGRRPRSRKTLTVRLEELDALVREAELADDIESAIVALEGPFANRRTEREAEVRAWEALFGNARDAVADSAILVEWLDGMRSSGLLKRLTASDLPQARNLLWQAISVLRNLPREGIPLPAFAANVLGDSHALDRGTPLSSILLRGIAMLGGVDTWQSPDQRRDAWSAVGVICDELSHPVLVWNLQLPDAHPLRDWLSAGAKLGEPFYLTTRQLL